MAKNKHGNDIHEHAKSKVNHQHKFVFSLSQISNKHVAVQNLLHLEKYKTTMQNKNSKLKIIASVWNNEIMLSDGSWNMKHETLATNPHKHIYKYRINNR